MQNIVRGNEVEFTAVFKSTPAHPYAQPAGVFIRVTYVKNSARQTAEGVMSKTGDVWTYVWNSIVANAGQVDYWILSNGELVASTQGSFMLLANTANT